jgi:hypothetical protein
LKPTRQQTCYQSKILFPYPSDFYGERAVDGSYDAPGALFSSARQHRAGLFVGPEIVDTGNVHQFG